MFICSADAFFERDVVFFRYQEFCVIATILEIDDDSSCDFSGVGCFEEFSVRAAFPGSVEAVAVVDEDFHGAVG